MMGRVLLEIIGMIPPRTARVEGGRKTVVCSCRGMGIGASEVHDGDLVGWERAVMRSEKATRIVCIV